MIQNETKTKITAKEHKVLSEIANSEYQNGDSPVGQEIWLDYVVDSKSRGGVLSSLLKKGLVTATIVPKSKSSNREAGISDSTIAITQAGMDAIGA